LRFFRAPLALALANIPRKYSYTWSKVSVQRREWRRADG
jgi:hypothetical protein